MKVGYVGLGAMGGALAGRLLPDLPPVVWDLNPDAVERMVRMGASTVPALSDVARACDVVILCLPRSESVEQALFSQGGLADGLTPGKIVVDQTSGLPAATGAMARRLEERGVAMVDAPVAGGVPAARAGRVTIMMSGAEDVCDTVGPILRTISPKVYRCGTRVGDGQALKLVNNSINAGYRMATLEIVALGRKLGLSLPAMTRALNDGRGANFTSRALLTALVEDRPSTDFALALMIKDLNQALALGFDCGAPLPVTTIARGLMLMSRNALGDGARLDDVVGSVEAMAGTVLRVPPDKAPADEARLLELVGNSVAACNRAVALENAALGVKLGLDVDLMATVVNDGSAWSADAECLLPALSTGRPSTRTTLGEAAADLTELVRLSMAHGAPVLAAGEVRAIIAAAANAIGPDASLDALTGCYEAAAGATFRKN